MQHVIPALPAEHLASLLEVEESYWWHAERRRWVCALISKFLGTPRRLADVGCGTGETGRQLADCFQECEITLVDAVDCRAPTNRSMAFILSDACEFTLKEEAQVITLLDVIEHIQAPVKALECVHRNLIENGIVIVTVPGHSFLYSKWDKKLGHLKRYSVGELKKELEGAGFKIEFVSHLFSFAVPYLFLRKFSKASTIFPRLVFPLPWILRLAAAFERKCVSVLPSFFGTSIVAVARVASASARND